MDEQTLPHSTTVMTSADESKPSKTEASAGRKLYFLGVSSLVFGGCLFYIDMTGVTFGYASLLAVYLVGILVVAHKNRPMTALIPTPETRFAWIIVGAHIVSIVAIGPLYPWIFVGLAGTMVGISVYGIFRQPVRPNRGDDPTL